MKKEVEEIFTNMLVYSRDDRILYLWENLFNISP